MRAPDVSGVVLTGCGLVLLATFVTMAALGDLYATASSFVGLFVLASLAYGVAVAWIVRRPNIGRGGLAGIVVTAVAFRLVLLPTAPTLSTDLYRYLWDGRVSVAGLSPYRYPPTAPELSALRDEAIYPRLNHPDWRTIYPPGAQLLFTGMARLAPGNVVAFKLLIVALDLLALALLVSWLRTLGHSPAWALVYAWHPLVVVEFAGSGHLDAVAVAASVAALVAADRRREGWSGALLGLGAVVKLYPLLLLPAVWRHRPSRVILGALGVMVTGYALYAGEGPGVLGSLPRYVDQEHFNPPLRAALEIALAGFGAGGVRTARLLPLAGLAAFALVVGIKARHVPTFRRAGWLVGAYLVTTPNLFPWYVVWMVPVLSVAPTWPWLSLTCTVALTYVALAQPMGVLPDWVLVAEWLPLAAGLALGNRTRLRQMILRPR